MRPGRAVPLLALAAALLPAAAHAQYFGRNKVQYHDFDFQVLKTPHFEIYYYPEEKEVVQHAARMAERWYARLSRTLGHRFTRPQPLILYASHPHFQQTNALGGLIEEGTGGVTEVLKRRVVLPFAGPLAETDHVLGHELVHAFQFDMTGQGPVSSGNVPAALRMPLWFIEGMAEYLSVGRVDPHTAMWLRDAARLEKLPTIRQLDDPRYFPYRYGQALWAYVAGRWGDEVLGDAIAASVRGADAETILEEITGLDSATLSAQWHAAIYAAYGPIFRDKRDAWRYGKALVTDKNAGRVNVGPALSPDGRRLVFLSEKDLFSIDMFLADAHTGQVRRKVVETAVDPHFESLQFINSAGAWDAAGKRFAFGGVRTGAPVLSIRDLEGGKELREVRFKDLGEVYDPTWSPDGQRIAFSALVGGALDLFVYDLRANTRRRLTSDAFADLQPSWSPDGRTLAFVTDRFSTRLDTLTTGNYRLAALDLESGEVRALPSFEDAKNIDPQWSADGRSLFFLSDQSGITNVYRLDVAAGTTFQVTDLITGASGITGLSPSLSVAADRLAVSVYEDGGHRIYSIEGDRMQGHPLGETEDRRRAATLPSGPCARVLGVGCPRETGAAAVARVDPPPAPSDARFEVKDYKPRLTLDYIGQPYLGVAVNSRGAFGGGGASFLFSDVLGHHTLATVLQVNGRFEDFGGVVAYENRKHRWVWGAGLQQVPYLTGSFSTRIERQNGQDVFVEQAELFRQTNRSASASIAYPFSRASRVELTGAARNITFGREVLRQGFSPRGDVLFQDRREIDAPAGISFAEMGAALVYDTAVYGIASPILGRRYRFEVTPTVGDVRFTGVLADFRQYVMPVRPVTLAGRVVHYGRYGGDSEDTRLLPLFLGYPNLVRGYDVNSFSARECGPDPVRCPVLNHLVGSRLLVANLELRIPPFGTFGGGRRVYGPLPLELIAFADGGVAWTAGEQPDFLGGRRKLVTSLGGGVRANVLGFVIAELDVVKPLDRPDKGWSFLFNLSPGF
jgi:WD40 repeat protein